MKINNQNMQDNINASTHKYSNTLIYIVIIIAILIALLFAIIRASTIAIIAISTSGIILFAIASGFNVEIKYSQDETQLNINPNNTCDKHNSSNHNTKASNKKGPYN